MNEIIDDVDRKLLIALQQDATLSLETLADTLGVSTNTCWRRVKRLEEAGIILRRVSIVDAQALGFGQTVFIAVKTRDHSQEWLDRFAAIVSRIPDVVEFYRMAGEVDYLLKVICRDVSDYDRVYKTLIREMKFADVSATFAMECIKNTTEIPL